MKTTQEVLTKEQTERYQEGWKNFKDKYKVNIPRNVHSGMPVISFVYHFEDTPVFRAHVFSKRMRKFDPYHQARKYIQPIWHAQHYMMVGEQMYTASSQLVIGSKYDKQIAKDVPVEFNWKKPVLWSDNISVELIREELGKVGPYEKQSGFFAFYSEKSGRALSRMSALSFWLPRAYVRDIENIKQGNASAVEPLLRKIERQAVNHSHLTTKRKTLAVTKEILIEELNKGNLPEEKLHDFFSLWD